MRRAQSRSELFIERGKGMVKISSTQLVFAILIALVIACIFVAGSDQKRSSMIWRGDFPGIYVPARIYLDGEVSKFYDRDTQQFLQNKFWPSLAGTFYISSYPQNSVLLVAPVAFLPPLGAKIVWTVGMLILAVVSLFYFAPSFLA